MSQIISIRDPQIILPDIKIDLTQTSKEEIGESTNNFENIMQTKVTGIMMPLMALNGVAVPYGDIIEFKLDWTKHLPEVEFVFIDRDGKFSQFIKPGISNEFQVQIIPPFDNAYKKVNLLFYVTEILINFGQVRGRAKYKVLDLLQGRFQSFGELSTFELCDKISQETGLGFASNILVTEDSRYMYCPMKSYLDILEKEIENSDSGEEHVYDYWIDLWNNLILCDMLDRYNSVDDEEDMMIWSSDQLNNPSTEFSITPYQTPAIFSNTPIHANSELYLQGYTFNTSPSGYTQGTSKVVSVYSEETHDYVENYTADGDVLTDEFLVHEYVGEFYGTYNYLFAKQCRDMYLRKVYGETLSIYTNQPLLGVSRGDQVRVVWYDADTTMYNKMKMVEGLGGTSQKDLDLGWLSTFIPSEDSDNAIILNTNVSGQYTIIGSFISFKNHHWTQEFILGRPANRKTPLIPDEILLGENDII